MEAPNWTEITSAISSVIAAVATVGTAGVAIIALIFARRAARAAQDQVKLLESQVRLSEPKPIVLFRFAWVIGMRNPPILEIENVGEDLAFDVEVSGLTTPPMTESKMEPTTLNCGREPILRIGQKLLLRYQVSRPINPPGREAHFDHAELRQFLSILVSRTLGDHANLGHDLKRRYSMGTPVLTYRNARGQTFSNRFDLYVVNERTIECVPDNSLVMES